MDFFLTIAMLLIGIPSVVMASAYSPHLDIDVLHYDMSMTIRSMKAIDIPVTAIVNLKSVSALDAIELDIEKTSERIQQVERLVGKKTIPLAFSIVDAEPGNYSVSGTHLHIALDHGLSQGQSIRLRITYSILASSMNRDMGLMFHSDYYGIPVLNVRSWPYYTRFFLPSNDHPSDKATFRFHIAVPDGQVAIANGRRVSSSLKKFGADRLRVFDWVQDRPIQTYNVNLAIGKFTLDERILCYNTDRINDELLDDCSTAQHRLPFVWAYPPLPKKEKEDYKEQIDKAARSVVFYSSVFGQYPYDKIGFIVAPQPFSMESVGLITLISPRSAVHEVAHQWWGNTVSFRHWGDFWISEGFTTYFTGYYDEFLSGTNSAQYLTDGVLSYATDVDPMDIFTWIPYRKGANAIRDLRERLERESPGRFLPTIQALFHDYRFSTITTPELVHWMTTTLSADSTADWSKAWFE